MPEANLRATRCQIFQGGIDEGGGETAVGHQRSAGPAAQHQALAQDRRGKRGRGRLGLGIEGGQQQGMPEPVPEPVMERPPAIDDLADGGARCCAQ